MVKSGKIKHGTDEPTLFPAASSDFSHTRDWPTRVLDYTHRHTPHGKMYTQDSSAQAAVTLIGRCFYSLPRPLFIWLKSKLFKNQLSNPCLEGLSIGSTSSHKVDGVTKHRFLFKTLPSTSTINSAIDIIHFPLRDPTKGTGVSSIPCSLLSRSFSLFHHRHCVSHEGTCDVS